MIEKIEGTQPDGSPFTRYEITDGDRKVMVAFGPSGVRVAAVTPDNATDITIH